MALRWEAAVVLLAMAGCTRVSVTVHNETESPVEYEAFEVEDGTERKIGSGRLPAGGSEDFSFSSKVKDAGGVLIRAEVRGVKLERDDCYLTPNQITENCHFFVFDDAILNYVLAQERQGK